MTKYKATTHCRHAHPVADNVLPRPLVATRPHQVWMTDITDIATDEGWLDLASVADLYSRHIVGWAMSERMPQNLVLHAFDQAVARYQPPAGGVHHSDRGSPYAAQGYRDRLTAAQMTASMHRKGNGWDNAGIASWHSLLKKARIYRCRWPTRAAATQASFEYLEIFYNRQRLHRALGYCTPHAVLTAGTPRTTSLGG